MSFLSIVHLSPVVVLSTAMSSLLAVQLSLLVALEHLSVVVSLPSVVRLSVLVALGHFPTAVSIPSIVLKEIKTEGRHFRLFVSHYTKNKQFSLISSLM